MNADKKSQDQPGNPIEGGSPDKKQLLQQLMEEYGQSVARLAYTYVKDVTIAEDVAQEVFIKCYRKLDEFRQESSYKTWLFKITVNQSKDLLKSWNVKKVFPTEFSSHRGNQLESSSREQTPEQFVISNERKEIIANAVLFLPVKLREVIILYYYEGQKIEEIADLLNIKVNTIKTRLMRARQKLKKMIGGSGFEQE
jgi:RNA polymerase sigma factor (sigma-70 family)